MNRVLRTLISLAFLTLSLAYAAPVPGECGDGIAAAPDACGSACCCATACICESPVAPNAPSPSQVTAPATSSVSTDTSVHTAIEAWVAPVDVTLPARLVTSHPVLDHSEKALARLHLLQI